MFQVGDKIVHPMHGAGIVDSIVQKKVNGAGVLHSKASCGRHAGDDPH